MIEIELLFPQSALDHRRLVVSNTLLFVLVPETNRDVLVPFLGGVCLESRWADGWASLESSWGRGVVSRQISSSVHASSEAGLVPALWRTSVGVLTFCKLEVGYTWTRI